MLPREVVECSRVPGDVQETCGHSGLRLTAGLYDTGGLFQLKQFYESMIKVI